MNKQAEDKKKDEVTSEKNEIKRIKDRFIYFGRKKKLKQLEESLNEKKGVLYRIQTKIKKQTEYVDRIYTQLKDIDVYIGGDKLHMDNIEL